MSRASESSVQGTPVYTPGVLEHLWGSMNRKGQHVRLSARIHHVQLVRSTQSRGGEQLMYKEVCVCVCVCVWVCVCVSCLVVSDSLQPHTL